MKRLMHLLMSAVLLLAGCTAATEKETALYDAGVSLQLARHRKSSINELEYSLFFAIPEEREHPVEGKVEISFSIDSPQDIIIDYRETGNIKEVKTNGKSFGYTVLNEHAIIPASSMRKGSNSIEIAFTAADQSLNRNEEFLYTLLVPDRARTLFPCFDQPDMKATYRLTLEVPAEWSAVSNTAVAQESEEGGRKRITFNPTEPLSTYLFSFVAGEFKKEVYNDGKHTFAAYYRETDPKRTAQLPTIIRQVADALEWMENYTGVPYPFAKYDFIILPGFQYGGMEHTGATLYNDTQLFLGEHPTPDEELRRMQLIAHETAHMWFGDLVTMQWFNDVWTKEVFANYFAARITEPQFPDINHRLEWLKSIVTPALSEDRTAGGTAIRQPLDNMRNAGLIYNNIIYDKAPVMLEKLVEIMGEEAFRDGMHEYLTEYAYSNATWDDLITILDSRSNADLAAFSDAWVNRRGMPHIAFSIDKDTLTVRHSDPYGRGVLWQQKFSVTLIGDKQYEIGINITDTLLRVPIAKDTKYILPNSDGKGYGYFICDSKSQEWVLENWHTMTDDICRQAQLMNLHEAYQHGALDAVKWLASLIDGLRSEKNALIASTACSYIYRPLVECGAEYEAQVRALADEHPIASCRLQLMRALIPAAISPGICTELYDIWKHKSHPLLGENDYMNLAYELALRFPERRKEIIETQRSNISDPDRLRQFDFISRATTPDTLEQEKLFRSLLQAGNRRIEPWALKTLGYLCHHTRQQQAVKYIRPGLDALQEIQRTSDIFFPQNWTRTLLKEQRDAEVARILETFFNDNPDYPVLLKSKIMQAAWPYVGKR
ncbi:MAG: aminopeptidase [Bacteroidaceae bacterium]|nr:aminopeptidase [Bacteroidaceae bacterium]